MSRFIQVFLLVFLVSLSMGCGRNAARPVQSTPPQMAAQQAAAPSQATQQAPPAIELAEKEHDFGKIAEDKEYVHIFKFKNTGMGPLEIKKVLPG